MLVRIWARGENMDSYGDSSNLRFHSSSLARVREGGASLGMLVLLEEP